MAVKYLEGLRIQGTDSETRELITNNFPDILSGLGADTNAVPTVESSTPIYGQNSLEFDPSVTGTFTTYVGAIGNHVAHGGSATKWNGVTSGDFTVTFWLKYTAPSGWAEGGASNTTRGVILNNVDSIANPTEHGFSIALDDGDTEKFQVHYSVGGGSNSDKIIDNVDSSAIALQEDKWHFYVFNFDNSGNTELKIYRDGVGHTTSAVTTINYNNTVTATSGNNATMDLGRTTGNNQCGFIGNLNDISIWERNLTEAEINLIFNGFDPSSATSSSNTGKNVEDSGISTVGCLAWFKCSDKVTGDGGFDGSGVTSTTTSVPITDVEVGTRLEVTDTRKIYRRVVGALENDTGLRFHYKFDEASGNVVNYGSVASADLTVSGLDRDQSTPSGLGNGMNSGDQSGEYASNTSRVNDYKFMHDGTAKWSVTFWAYLTSVPHSLSPTEKACMGNVWTDDNGIGWTIRWAYGGSTTSCRLQTFIADGDAGMPLNDQTGDDFMPDLNAWHFYCVTYDPTLSSNHLTVTRDARASGTEAQGFHQGAGNEVGSYSSSNPTRRTTYFSRWQDSSHDITMGGRLAQVMIWEDKILTQAEKLALYVGTAGTAGGTGTTKIASSWKEKGTA